MDEKKKVLLVAGMCGGGKTYYCQTLKERLSALRDPISVVYRNRDAFRNDWVVKHNVPAETPYEDKYREPNEIYDDWLKEKMAGNDGLILIEHPFHYSERALRYSHWAQEQNRDVEMVLFFSKPEILAERVLKRWCGNIEELREKINNGEAEEHLQFYLSIAQKISKTLPEYRAASEKGMFTLRVIDNTDFAYRKIAEFGAGKNRILDKQAYGMLEDYAQLGDKHAFSFEVTENDKAKNGYDVKVTISDLPVSLQISTAAPVSEKIKGGRYVC